MRIYLNREETPINMDLARVRIGPDFFLLLEGVNLNFQDKQFSVEPVYRPLFTLRREAGRTALSLQFWREAFAITIILQETAPYIHVAVGRESALEDCDEEDE